MTPSNNIKYPHHPYISIPSRWRQLPRLNWHGLMILMPFSCADNCTLTNLAHFYGIKVTSCLGVCQSDVYKRANETLCFTGFHLNPSTLKDLESARATWQVWPKLLHKSLVQRTNEGITLSAVHKVPRVFLNPWSFPFRVLKWYQKEHYFLEVKW